MKSQILKVLIVMGLVGIFTTPVIYADHQSPATQDHCLGGDQEGKPCTTNADCTLIGANCQGTAEEGGCTPGNDCASCGGNCEWVDKGCELFLNGTCEDIDWEQTGSKADTHFRDSVHTGSDPLICGEGTCTTDTCTGGFCDGNRNWECSVAADCKYCDNLPDVPCTADTDCYTRGRLVIVDNEVQFCNASNRRRVLRATRIGYADWLDPFLTRKIYGGTVATASIFIESTTSVAKGTIYLGNPANSVNDTVCIHCPDTVTPSFPLLVYEEDTGVGDEAQMHLANATTGTTSTDGLVITAGDTDSSISNKESGSFTITSNSNSIILQSTGIFETPAGINLEGTTCFDVSADQIYHDTDCNGTKDAGEEFVDALPLTGGRNLTVTAGDIAVDAEIYTDTKDFSVPDPVVGDDQLVQPTFATAVTITRIWCSTDVGTVTIQFDERAEATPNTAGIDVMTTALVCDSDTQATTSFANATIAAEVPMNFDIDAVATSPTVVRVHVKYTIDD